MSCSLSWFAQLLITNISIKQFDLPRYYQGVHFECVCIISNLYVQKLLQSIDNDALYSYSAHSFNIILCHQKLNEHNNMQNVV